MEVGYGGSRGQTEVAMKAGRQQPYRLRNGRERGPILAANVGMVTLRKRRQWGQI